MKISVKGVEAAASGHAPGYAGAVLSASVETSPGILEIPSEDYARISAAFSKLPPVRTQIRSAITALRKFAAAGVPVCEPRTVANRKEICAGSIETTPCEWHRPSKIFLLSACAKCGCRGLKLYMETEKCPVGKW